MRRPFTAFFIPRKPLKVNSRFLFPFTVFFILLFVRPGWGAESAAGPDTLIRKMSLRQGSWTALNAAVELEFKTFSGNVARCSGTLVYSRLDEKTLLSCQGQNGNLVFALKTYDKDFELYLPSRQTLYRGSVFSLEDTPSIESHLKPLDLYRALKSVPFKPGDVVSIKEKNGNTEAVIQTQITRGRSKKRKVEVSAEGDILREAYAGFDGKTALIIKRLDFETMDGRSAFPKKIVIKSVKDLNVRETVLRFRTVSFPASLPDELFGISVPGDVSIEEVS
jgi:hypothetical protein